GLQHLPATPPQLDPAGQGPPRTPLRRPRARPPRLPRPRLQRLPHRVCRPPGLRLGHDAGRRARPAPRGRRGRRSRGRLKPLTPPPTPKETSHAQAETTCRSPPADRGVVFTLLRPAQAAEGRQRPPPGRRRRRLVQAEEAPPRPEAAARRQ